MFKIDQAIKDTNAVICKNIARFDSSERGLLSQNILGQLRNFVEYIISKKIKLIISFTPDSIAYKTFFLLLIFTSPSIYHSTFSIYNATSTLSRNPLSLFRTHPH